MNGFIRKAGLGLALAATALTAAAPAEAQRWGRYRHYDRGGDVAAGALLGGLVGLGIGAAVANSNRDRYYYDRGYAYDGYYNGPPPPPRAYYYDDYRYDYRPRCWTQWRWDPYWGRNAPVQVCN